VKLQIPRKSMLAGVALLALAGCKTHHTVHIDPIEVKPMTLNVNIRVEREVEEFFDFKKQPVAEGGTMSPAGGATP
jgi:hypothetical protein